MPVRFRLFRGGSLALLAGLFVLISLHESMSQDQPTPPDRPPAEDAPTRRTLAGDDARQVELLEREVAELGWSGKFAEAQEPARKILAIRTRMQGADHWQTADAERQVRTLAQVAATSPEVRAEFASLYRIVGIAADLMQQARYAEAEPHFRRVMAICERVLGEDHPDTATSYDNLGVNFYEQGKHAEAEPLLRKALTIRERVLGEDHPDTVRSYNNLAGNLDAQSKHAEAEPLLRKALTIQERVLGEEHPNTARSYINLAYTLNAQRKIAEAELLYRKALAICERVLGEDHPLTATSYGTLSDSLNAQGKYAEAERLYRKVMAVCERVLGKDHPDTATSYNKLGANLYAQGRHAEAEALWVAAARSFEAARRPISHTGLERATFAVRGYPVT
ncbi:MAG TPA: tetratricopeptide repeat protein [Isosphaeraceae bacterium]